MSIQIKLPHGLAIVEQNGINKLGTHLQSIIPKGQGLIITDSNVGPLYAQKVHRTLKASGFNTSTSTIPAGEKSKGFETFTKVAETVASLSTPITFVVGLGGGVVGDFSGFLAAIYRRGVPHVQIPTSLMAQVDSSVGGKNGLNAIAAKNMFGTILQPVLTLVDTQTLHTLGDREFYSGFGEIIKHMAISSPATLVKLSKIAKTAISQNLETLIAQNIRIKKHFVQNDILGNKGIRDQLNFGHTVGHAIEQVAGYGTYLHGEAISMGMVVALSISNQYGLPTEASAKVISLLEAYQLPTTIPANLVTTDLLEVLKQDKKFQGTIRFVLLKTLGKPYISNTVTYKAIAKAIDKCRIIA